MNKTEKNSIPTNMSVYNCHFPENNNILFKTNIEPVNKKGYKYLNPQVYDEKTSKNFEKVLSRDPYIALPNGSLQPCNVENQVIAADPRLYSASHAQWLALDRPPIDSSMKLSKIILDKKLDKYGQYYSGYKDINAGQIEYYFNRSIEDPFFSPNYATSAVNNGRLYKDPMGAMKPQYERVPLTYDNPITTGTRDKYQGCLSWIQDSMNHREDIMSLQQRKRNQEEYMYRYSL
tara:strand:+ start:181 stop:879 length:699 start_codon:yes stop_codon:yes gene_type:complete